jgi:hypothetical protein
MRLLLHTASRFVPSVEPFSCSHFRWLSLLRIYILRDVVARLPIWWKGVAGPGICQHLETGLPLELLVQKPVLLPFPVLQKSGHLRNVPHSNSLPREEAARTIRDF